MKDSNFWISVLGSSSVTAIVTAFITRKKTNAEARNLQYEGTNTHIEGTKNFMEVWQQSLARLETEMKQLKEERKIDKDKISTLYGKVAKMERENMVYLVCIHDHDIDFDQWLHNFEQKNSTKQEEKD